MYIIAIGWLYVTLLVAANEPTIIAGIISFLFYGLLHLVSTATFAVRALPRPSPLRPAAAALLTRSSSVSTAGPG